MPSLSIIFGYRDRDLVRVKRCFDSLSRQNFNDFEAIFIDYGSQYPLAGEMKQMIETYPFAKYIYCESMGMPWNRSHALNIGVKNAQGEYIVTTDIDMIYEPNFFQTLWDNRSEKKVNHVFHLLLPEKFSKWDQLSNIRNLEVAHNAHGACHMIQKKHYEKMGGFDEFYCYWGVEDRDLKEREMKMGLEICDLKDQTYMHHQWHAKADYSVMNFMPVGHWIRMENHFWQQSENIVRNNGNWGKNISPEQRPLLQIIHEKDYRNKYKNRIHFLNLKATKSSSVSEMLQAFNKLKSDEILAVENAFYPPKSSFFYFLIDTWNKAMRVLKLGYEITINSNILHSSIFPFATENKALIADYFLYFEEGNGISFIMKK